MPDELERRYRRLLLAYPARYRRRRGLEMLTTLMDSASLGSTKPSLTDAASLILGGLRCRLALGGASVLVAVVVAVFVAVLGGISGAVAGWQTAPDLPDDTTAAAIVSIANPNLPTTATDRRDFLFGYDIPVQDNEKVLVARLGGDEYTAGYLQFTHTHPGNDLASLQASHDRLQAAGWRVEPVRQAAWGGEFSAAKGELVLKMALQGDGETSLWINRAAPPLVPVLTVIGLLLGAFTGWLLGGWAGRRGAAQPPVRKTLATASFVLGSVLMVFPTIFNLVALAGSLWTPEPVPVWIGYVFIFFRGFALLGTALLVVSLLIVYPRPPQEAVPSHV